MIVGGYSLDLYCENDNTFNEGVYKPDGIHGFREFPHEFAGNNRAEAVREARMAGWRVNVSAGKCYCPKCNRVAPVTKE